MNQSEIISAVAEKAKADAEAINKTGVTKEQTMQVMLALAGVVQEQLKLGGDVLIPGVGKLKVVETAAKTGRNPKTGEAVEIPAKRKPKFTPIKALKDAVAL